MSEFGQLSESMRVCYFRWTSLGVIIDPSPAPTAVIVALDGTQSALTLTKQGTGTATRFYPDFSQASAGLYEILATTTDTTVDAATFQEFVRVGQTWVQGVATVLARMGSFTGTGVNTILGFLKALGSKEATTPSDMGGSYDAATDSTEAILDSLAETAELVDATWDELIAAHLAAGTTGEALADAAGGSGLDAAAVRAAIGLASANLDTQLDALPTNTELATALATADDAVLAAVAALNNLSAAGVRSAIGMASANLDTQLSTIVAFIDTEIAAILAAVDTEVAAIKAKTDNLPSDPADESLLEAAITAAVAPLATQASLDTLDNFVDTEVAALLIIAQKLDTALELDGLVYRYTANALEQAPVTGSAPSAAVIADAVWDELIAGHLTADTTGARLNAAGAGADPWSIDLPGAYSISDAGGLFYQIYLRSQLLTAGRINLVSSYNARTGKLTLYKGDTPLMTFTGLDPGLTGATNVKLAIRAAGTTGAALKTLTGVVVSDTALAVQFTTGFFTDLLTGDCVYEYDVQATLVGGEIRSPIWRSELEIVDDIAA